MRDCRTLGLASGWRGPRWRAAILFAGALLTSVSVGAEDWKLTLSGTVGATATTNANLAPSGQQQADFIGTITPAINVSLPALASK